MLTLRKLGRTSVYDVIKMAAILKFTQNVKKVIKSLFFDQILQMGYQSDRNRITNRSVNKTNYYEKIHFQKKGIYIDFEVKISIFHKIVVIIFGQISSTKQTTLVMIQKYFIHTIQLNDHTLFCSYPVYHNCSNINSHINNNCRFCVSKYLTNTEFMSFAGTYCQSTSLSVLSPLLCPLN